MKEFEMDKEREEHLLEVKRVVAGRIDVKYRKGQAEHGGDLWAKPMLENLEKELTDASVYFVTLERRIMVCQELVSSIKSNISIGDAFSKAFALDQLDELDSMLRSL